MARINWNEPKFGEDELKEVSEVINSGYVNEGPKTRQLEEEIKKYLGVKYVLLTANATAGLFLAVKADSIIRERKDFEVIVPDLTMIATATSVSWAGGKPVIVDVERERATIDTSKITEKINDRTTAIIPVHILGRSADMDKLLDFANKHNLTIIEDAAGALGSKDDKGRYLGTIGKVGIYSLQANKIITSGQGGIIVTNDDKYYEIIRRLRDFGRFSNKEFIHEKEGYNLKFNDLSAALALAQFRKIEEKKSNLIKQKELYEKELTDVKEVKFVKYNPGEIPLWVDILVKNRSELVKYLNNYEIYSRECWPSLHINPPYRKDSLEFSNSAEISTYSLWLPNGPSINDEQIIFVCSKIKEFYNHKQIELKKIYEDKRGYIYLAKDLLENNKEFTFLEIKKGYSRGGCLHSKDEYFVVIRGAVKVISGKSEKIYLEGESGIFPAGESHAFIAVEDSIVSEWGITTEEKQMDKKDSNLRSLVDEINGKRGI